MAPQNSTPFFDAVKNRRTYYALQKQSTIPDARLQEIVNEAVISTPSAFNGQSSRVFVLLGDDHDRFWGFVWEAVKPHLHGDKEREAGTKGRLDGFANAYGTILFTEDPAPNNELAAKFKSYADKFPQWSEHHNGMLQYVVWTALEAEGMGANLQHYNPIVDVDAKKEWKIPSTWDIKAQLVFGKLKDGEQRKGWTEGKDVQPVEERVFWHGVKL